MARSASTACNEQERAGFDLPPGGNKGNLLSLAHTSELMETLKPIRPCKPRGQASSQGRHLGIVDAAKDLLSASIEVLEDFVQWVAMPVAWGLRKTAESKFRFGNCLATSGHD